MSYDKQLIYIEQLLLLQNRRLIIEDVAHEKTHVRHDGADHGRRPIHYKQTSRSYGGAHDTNLRKNHQQEKGRGCFSVGQCVRIIKMEHNNTSNNQGREDSSFSLFTPMQ